VQPARTHPKRRLANVLGGGSAGVAGDDDAVAARGALTHERPHPEDRVAGPPNAAGDHRCGEPWTGARPCQPRVRVSRSTLGPGGVKGEVNVCVVAAETVTSSACSVTRSSMLNHCAK
jgi:hypothetical protein